MVYQFQQEQNLTDMYLDQLNSGDVYTRRDAAIAKDEKIKFLCKNFKTTQLKNYLDGLIANF